MGTIPSECGFPTGMDAAISYVHSQVRDSVGWGCMGWSLLGSFPPAPEGLYGTLDWALVPALKCGQLSSLLEEGALWHSACRLLPQQPTSPHWDELHHAKGALVHGSFHQSWRQPFQMGECWMSHHIPHRDVAHLAARREEE